MSRLIALYPAWWRDRYGDEMLALLESGRAGGDDRFDLGRGALDAWLHPPEASLVPALSAIVGGGLWTVVASGVVAQPAVPDWPGYLIDLVPIALVAVLTLAIAQLAITLRASDRSPRSFRLAVTLTGLGFGGWIVALSGTWLRAVPGPGLAAAQTAAMISTVMVGLVLLRVGSAWVGGTVVVVAVVMLIPGPGPWLVYGAGWTALGIGLMAERARRSSATTGLA